MRSRKIHALPRTQTTFLKLKACFTLADKAPRSKLGLPTLGFHS